jgi:hypothetical protein
LSVYAKIALGLCAVGVLLIVGVFTTLLRVGGEEVSSGASGPGGLGSSKTQSESSYTSVEEKAVGGETTQGAGEDAGRADEKAASAEPVTLPDYEMLDERDAKGLRQIDVRTEAKGEQQMRLIAEDLRSYAPRDGILLLDFNRQNGPPEGTGFAMVFDSRAAAANPDLSYTEEEEESIFEEDGGIRVVSFKESRERDPNLVEEAEGLLSNL